MILQQFNLMLHSYKHLFVPLLTFAGSLFLLSYLSNVNVFPFYLFVIGVAIIVLSAIFSYKMLKSNHKTEPFFLLSIYIIYVSLMFMPFIRFNTLVGCDILREYKAAEIVFEMGWNTPASIASANACTGVLDILSCLSVTVLPSIFSMITSVELINVFAYVLSGVAALIPLMVYMNVKQVFERRDLAAVSSILYIQFGSAFSGYPIGGARQLIAILFLLFTIFLIVKLIKQKRVKYIPLFAIFTLSVATSHYTITYFYGLIFLLFILALYGALKSRKIANLLKIKFKKKFQVDIRLLFIISLVTSLIWLIYIPTSPFISHIQGFMTLSPVSDTPEFGQVTSNYLFGVSPLGPIIDNWYRLSMILTLIGFLFFAFKMKKDSSKLLWFIAGGTFFAFFLTTFIPQFHLMFGEFLRTYGIGYPILCSFLAVSLLKLDKKGRGYLLMVFLLLNLPLNMLLPVHYRYVLYHNEDHVDPSIAVAENYLTQQEFHVSQWINNYVKNGAPISTDNRGFYDLANATNTIYGWNEKSLDFLYDSNYLFIHRFTIEYGFWLQMEQLRKTDTKALIDSSNILYNNGNGMVLMKK